MMDGNIGKTIASMTIKQSYGVACVRVDLLMHSLWYSVLPSNLLGSCDKQAELWSTLEAAIVATTDSLSSTSKLEWHEKHRKLGIFFLPQLLFISPALCAFQFVERAHLHPSVVSPRVAVAWRPMLPSPAFDGLCLHLSLHKMDNEENACCILSSRFSRRLAYSSLAVFTLLPCTQNANRWTWKFVFETLPAMKKIKK